MDTTGGETALQSETLANEEVPEAEQSEEETPVEEKSAEEGPSVDTPVDEEPSVDTSADEEPSAEQLNVESHIVKKPAAGDAADNTDAVTHTHKIDGADVEFIPWNNEEARKQWDEGVKASECLPKEAGHYFLTVDVSLSDEWEFPSDLHLCLNGHNITTSYPSCVMAVKTGISIDIYDEAGDKGQIRNDIVMNGGSLTLHGGTIANKSVGVAIKEGSRGSFTMNGGKILSNSGGVTVVGEGSSFVMNGGTITDDGYSDTSGSGVSIRDGSFTMNGGTITGNNNNAAGGVNLVSGTFTMNGGSITNNSAVSGGGGGVNILNVAFVMKGGSITGNSARRGGGVYYNGLERLHGTFEISGPVEISDNKAGSADNNVLLPSNRKITVAGPIGNSRIGISVSGVNESDLPWDITQGLDGNGSVESFFSDSDDYQIVESEDGEAALDTGIGGADYSRIETIDPAPEIDSENLNKIAGNILTQNEIDEHYGLLLVSSPYDEGDVPAADKKALTGKAKALKATPGIWFDLSLYKLPDIWKDFSLDRLKEDAAVQLTTVPEPVQLTAEVPESLQKDGRTYILIACHDGEAEVVAKSTDTTFSWKRTKFSTYMIAYRDDSGSGSGSKKGSGSPRTGDDSPLLPWTLLLITGAGSLSALIIRRQRGR